MRTFTVRVDGTGKLYRDGYTSYGDALVDARAVNARTGKPMQVVCVLHGLRSTKPVEHVVDIVLSSGTISPVNPRFRG